MVLKFYIMLAFQLQKAKGQGEILTLHTLYVKVEHKQYSSTVLKSANQPEKFKMQEL
jgi:hypothetical protein